MLKICKFSRLQICNDSTSWAFHLTSMQECKYKGMSRLGGTLLNCSVLTGHALTWSILTWPLPTLPFLTWSVLTLPFCKLKLDVGLQSIQTFSIYPLETIFILSRYHLHIYTLHTLFRHLPDTFQVPSRHLPDTLKTHTRHPCIPLRASETLILI